MEPPTCLSVAISLACVFMITLSWSVINWGWLKPKRLEKCLRDQGFNGNSYRLLYGDTKDKARMSEEARSKPMSELSNHVLPRVQPFFHHIIKTYGKRCFTWNGPIPVVTIAEPELMREVFLKFHDFQKPLSNPLSKKVVSGLVQLEGQEWASRRKLLTPAFHMEKLKLMVPAFYESAYEMVKKWEAMTMESGSCEIDVWSYMRPLSADVISRAAFGSSYEEGKRIFQLLTEQLMVAIPVLNSVYIPGWRFVPTKANRRIGEINKEIRTLLKDIIQKRKKAINAGEKPKDDLLGILLHSSYQEKRHENNKNYSGLSLKEVIDECKIFYLAGQDTTSVLLVWTLVLLSKHTDWQSRAREEVLATFGNNNPDFHGLTHLKIVNMILQEVLRLYPPVIETNRTVNEDIKIGDVFLPAGIQVNLPIMLVQQDEDIWGTDTKEFNPERFSEGISKATGGNMSFFSFGWGPRICIGSNFAMTGAKLALSLILQRFSLELSPTYVHAPSAMGTIRPQFGAQIMLHPL